MAVRMEVQGNKISTLDIVVRITFMTKVKVSCPFYLTGHHAKKAY
jgi:hypothetical protein